MNQITLNKKGVRLAALLLAVFLSASLMLGSVRAQSQTQDQAVNEPLRTISVTGTGQVTAQPDRAVVMVGVHTEANTAQAALSQNNQQTTTLLNALKGAGIPETDLQTQTIQLQPRFEQSSGQSNQTPVMNGFTATNILQVHVRELDKLGEILDEAVSAGGNTIEGISFQISDTTGLEDQARAQALADARRKAEQMAAAVGAGLGQVISISEGSQYPIPFGQAREAAQRGGVPVMAGTQDVLVQVQVTWQLTAGSGAGLPSTGATATPARTPAVTQSPTSSAPTPAVTNLNDLASALRTAGATVRTGGEIQQPFFPVAGQVLSVNTVDVQVFEFRTETERKSASDTIASNGDTIGNSIPNWIGSPNIWAQGRLIVLYIGEDEQMMNLLSRALGIAIVGGGQQGGGQELPAAAAKAQQALAARLGVQASQVEVFSVTKQDWSDSCLGLGGPAESCLQVITPGYLVRLRSNGQQYEAHTDQNGSVIRWK